MPISHIEHFLVAADDIDATRDWYARVLGMKSGPHPDFGFPVHWMYVDNIDIVHIGPSAKQAGEMRPRDRAVRIHEPGHYLTIGYGIPVQFSRGWSP